MGSVPVGGWSPHLFPGPGSAGTGGQVLASCSLTNDRRMGVWDAGTKTLAEEGPHECLCLGVIVFYQRS